MFVVRLYEIFDYLNGLIDFNEVDMKIYLPKKWYSPRSQGGGEFHF